MKRPISFARVTRISIARVALEVALLEQLRDVDGASSRLVAVTVFFAERAALALAADAADLDLVACLEVAHAQRHEARLGLARAARDVPADRRRDLEVERAVLAVLVDRVADDLARAGMDRRVVGRAVGLVERAVAVAVGSDLAVGRAVAGVGEQRVGAGAAVDRVVAPVACVDRVVALLALDPVLGRAAGDRVVAAAARRGGCRARCRRSGRRPRRRTRPRRRRRRCRPPPPRRRRRRRRA